MTDYVTLRNDGDTKKKVNNITKENYKQLQLIASRREQKKTKKTLRSRIFALTVPSVKLIHTTGAGIVTLSLVQIKLWIVEIELNVLLVHLKRTLDPL